jgi:hypothetical protein
VKAYDPRKDEIVETENPALILGYYAELLASHLGREVDWNTIAEAADYCEEEVNECPT